VRTPSKRRRIVRWILFSTLAVVLVLVGLGALALRPERIKAQIVAELTARLKADVSIDSVKLILLPRVQLSGRHLTLRVKSRPDLPPFITIEKFWMDLSPLEALRHHVDAVHVDGLKIMIPPSESRAEVLASMQAPGDQEPLDPSKVLINHFISHDAELTFVPRDASKPALSFPIHALEIDKLAFDRGLPFHATLTNPMPTGRVETSGTFGPWRTDDPGQTPVLGEYVFLDANLNDINGIGGTLASKGKYSGHLTELRVEGETETPNFSLDLGGKPVPLETVFQAIVDGTDGTTVLQNVDARLETTKMNIKGGILNLTGPGRHDINLDLLVTEGRIEDLLRLVLDTPEPVLTGNVTLKSRVALPPGKSAVPTRLQLSGKFGLGNAEFSDKGVKDKLQELSRRSQGKKPVDMEDRVLSKLQGTFAFKSGLFDLRDIRFAVPGANVSMAGTYQLEQRVLDFRGELRMEASLSKAVGGVKSIFLKVLDPLFRKNGSGTVLPIRLSGTLDAPKFELDKGRIFGRK